MNNLDRQSLGAESLDSAATGRATVGQDLSGSLPTISELTKAGDQMQSAAARMAEWITGDGLDSGQIKSVPHEVLCAAIEAQDAVGEWTLARQKP